MGKVLKGGTVNMISVLASIRPFWCGKILIREKTVELRKTYPRAACGLPFKVYMYETKPGSGAVVGEFLCWFVERAARRPYQISLVKGSCLEPDEIAMYAGGKTVYGWHISNAIKYDQPVPLERFGLTRAPQSWCYVKEDVA
jgi:predicted transcriptional regulator